MDRRSFLKQAGTMGAGSVLACSWLGCAVDVGPSIPCLGPAAAPTPVPGMTYIWASQIGCALDCDLATGRNKHTGDLATDDGPRINAAMAGASATNPITLIIDGSTLISGLFLPGGGYWSIVGLGCGTGFFIKSGTNNDGIHNGGPKAAIPSDPGPPAPQRGSSVSLRNFTINGNRGNGYYGVSSSGVVQGINDEVWYFAVNLMNLDNIDVENVVVVNSPAYHMRFSNVGNVTVSGCVLKSQGPSTDGLHFDGPANDVTISNCHFTTGDDAIALNCPEGYSGNISRVVVTNCTFNSRTLMRLDTIQNSGNEYKFNIDTVYVSNCNGTLGLAGFLFGQGAGSNPDSINNLVISNCILTAPTILDIAANFGNVILNNITLTLLNDTQLNGFAFARTSSIFYGDTYNGTSLTFNNCMIKRNANLAVVALIVEYGSSISSLTFNGFVVKNAGSYTPAPELIKIDLGSIGQLVIDALDSSNIRNPVSAGGFASIGDVRGKGVLATQWEFPDYVMDDDVPYISATSGLPSIKVGGVVEPYWG